MRKSCISNVSCEYFANILQRIRDVLHVQFLLTAQEARRRSCRLQWRDCGALEQVPGKMIAPLLLYLSLITDHQTLLRGDIQAQLNHLNSSDEIRTTTISENSTEVTVSSTGKYEEIFRNTSNSHQELFKLNSTPEENPHSDETVFLKTTNLIPSSMIGYYQTNFSHSTEVKGKIRKAFLR